MSGVILEVVEGPDAGRQFDVTTAQEVGRGEEAGIVLTDPMASRSHVRLTPVADGVLVEDLGSTNGTFVNGNEIHAPTAANPGDQVLVGLTVLQVRTDEQVTAQRSVVRPVPPPLASAPRAPDFIPPELTAPPVPELDPLLDIRTKAKAKMAPLAIFLLAVFVVLISIAATR